MSKQSRVTFEQSSKLDHSLATWHPKNAQTDFCLPGQPKLNLADTDEVLEFLERDLRTPDIDRLEPYLWLISTPRADNITPLHRQRLRGRSIVPIVDPDLHLVWHRYQVFVKPLPAYLCSYAFWDHFILSPQP